MFEYFKSPEDPLILTVRSCRGAIHIGTFTQLLDIDRLSLQTTVMAPTHL